MIFLIPIEAHSLIKQFGQLTAVNNLDLRIAQGEFFGFIGPNGAGKTTTLQMLSGQLPPTSGTATVLGIDAAADPIEIKAAVGIVPELEYPPSFLTVEEYLHFVAAIRGLDDDDGRVDKWIEFFGLEDAHHPVHEPVHHAHSIHLPRLGGCLPHMTVHKQLPAGCKNPVPVCCCRSSRYGSTNTFIILLPNK